VHAQLGGGLGERGLAVEVAGEGAQQVAGLAQQRVDHGTGRGQEGVGAGPGEEHAAQPEPVDVDEVAARRTGGGQPGRVAGLAEGAGETAGAGVCPSDAHGAAEGVAEQRLRAAGGRGVRLLLGRARFVVERRPRSPPGAVLDDGAAEVRGRERAQHLGAHRDRVDAGRHVDADAEVPAVEPPPGLDGAAARAG
jgi:hypothetical protein